MSILDDMESDELVVYAAGIRKEYNDARSRFFNDARHYYNQSIAGSYYKETDLIEQLNKCERIRKHYIDVCDILKNRGLRPYISILRRSNDCVFKEASANPADILHFV